ncbi:MAG TPA: bifunctional glutamate N-acetyltransferase/amino-acid acetyltransferase ArgJ [Candidatus Binataceae bacterium]|nr:bifunctional glutamate N-acetyltransferase/amino-acid acetyltransferase ArgJ [Candidatus Binataceae bacterium]
MEVRLEAAPVRGFRFAGVAAGLRNEAGRKDLGTIVADAPVAAAGVFTTSRVKAAPVLVAQECLRGGQLRAIAANSGSANCFTGKAGIRLARESCAALAAALGCEPALVAPCSTGVIGHLYDLDRYREGMAAAAAALDPGGLLDFASAIMTTDTHPKVASTTIRVAGTPVTIAGCAKGAGMIEPKMATMLAFVVTDAALRPPQLRAALKNILPRSFNAITVDGDMSTNDTLVLMASGAAQNRAFTARDLATFEKALESVAATLARELVRDGEGASKLVTVEVRGARSEIAAERVARSIANSPLVKTAFFGCDPNFGRIAMAAGKAGVEFDPERLEVNLAGIRIASRGALNVEALAAAGAKMKDREFGLILDLKMGKASARVMTCDLSFDYVKINAEYTT